MDVQYYIFQAPDDFLFLTVDPSLVSNLGATHIADGAVIANVKILRMVHAAQTKAGVLYIMPPLPWTPQFSLKLCHHR